MGSNQDRFGNKGKMSSWKFWTFFVAVPIIVVIGSSMVAYKYVNSKSSKKQGAEQGLLYAKFNRHNEAIAEFRKVLKKDPENADIHYFIGLSYIKLKKYDKAVTEINNTLKIKPNHSNARLQLAAIKFMQVEDLRKLGKSESLVLKILLEAEDICKDTIEKDPNFIQTYALLGNIHSSQGLIDDAIIDYKHMLAVDNSSVDGHIALATLYMSKKDLDKTRKECDFILSELDPDNIQILFLMSTIYQQQGMYEESIASLRKILEKKPEDVRVLTQLGLLLLITSEYDKAFSEIEKAFKHGTVHTLPVVAYFIKGSVLLQRKKYKDAIISLKDVTIKAPKTSQFHYFLAIALSQDGRIEEAKSEFKSAIDLDPGYTPAKLSLAKLLMEDGWHMEAIKHCENLLKIQPDNVDALQMSGVAYMKIKDFEQAEVKFKKLLQLQPDLGDINLANLSLQSGQLSKCISQCEAIIESSPEETKIYNILGLAHIRRGSLDKGIEQFERVIGIKPDLDSAYLNLARAFVASEKTDEALNTIKQAVSVNPINVDARIMLAVLYQREGKLNEAIEAFENLLELDPEYLPGYAIAGLYFLNGEADKSIDVCNRALRLDPDNSVMRINLAVSYQQKENYSAASLSCQKAIELNPDMASYKIILSNIYASNEEYRKAKIQIESIQAINSDEKKAFLELLDLCLHNKEKSRQITFMLNKAIFARFIGVHGVTINECRKAEVIFPDNILSRIILASAYLVTKQNEEAIEVYNEIKKSKPEFTSPYYDLARAYISSDKEEEAISTYQDLLDVDSESVSARLAISGLLFRKGSLDEAAKMVSNAITLEPDSVLAHNLSGEISLATTEYEKAETSFSKVIELRNETFEGHFNLARTKFVQGEYDECIEQCNIALKIKTADVRVLNVLGIALLTKGMLGEAETVFNKILSINADFVPAYINLAKINMSTNNPAVAEILYKMALNSDQNAVEARFGLGISLASMGNHTEAISEFATIIKSYPDNIDMINSMAGSYMALKEFDKAQETVMSALEIKPENPIARSMLAMIHVENELIPEAVKQLNHVLVANPEFANAYGLAILYLDSGDYDKSILICKQGLEHYPESISLLCNMAASYLLKEDYVNAKKVCRRMLNFQPDDPIPNLCLVNTLLAEGAYNIAKMQIKSMVRLGKVNKTDYQELIDFCAQDKDMAVNVSQHLSRAIAYTNGKWFKRALREYEAITRVTPLSKLAYSAQIDILIMTRQDDKAIEICKKVLKLQPESPDVHIKLAGIYIRNGQKDEAEVQYRKTISIDTGNFTACLGLGVLLESKGLFDESIDLYKKAIELDSSSVEACNNLAWVYASKKQGKLKEAIKLAEKAKEIAPNSPAVVDTLGWVYYMNGLYDEATRELEMAVKDTMWNPTIRYHLGMAYYKNGLERKAMTEIQRALKIDRTFPEADDAREVIDKIISDRIN